MSACFVLKIVVSLDGKITVGIVWQLLPKEVNVLLVFVFLKTTFLSGVHMHLFLLRRLKLRECLSSRDTLEQFCQDVVKLLNRWAIDVVR